MIGYEFVYKHKHELLRLKLKLVKVAQIKKNSCLNLILSYVYINIMKW